MTDLLYDQSLASETTSLLSKLFYVTHTTFALSSFSILTLHMLHGKFGGEAFSKPTLIRKSKQYSILLSFISVLNVEGLSWIFKMVDGLTDWSMAHF